MNHPNLAPVVLFVYGRPIHTQRTIDALLQNPESKDTDLIVYSDGPKQHSDTEKVESVREIIKKTSGFKSINLIERTENLGLAENIIDGVTKVCDEYGKVIVLEDDIVTSPFFLNFMNSALNKYQSNEKVWHISGWNYPFKNTEELPETFFSAGANAGAGQHGKIAGNTLRSLHKNSLPHGIRKLYKNSILMVITISGLKLKKI